MQKTVPLPSNFCYSDLQEAYEKGMCCDEPIHAPRYVIVKPEIMSAIKTRFQQQNRFTQIGPVGTASWLGISFNSSTIVSSRYAPDGITLSDHFDPNDDFDEFRDWVMEVREDAENGIQGS